MNVTAKTSITSKSLAIMDFNRCTQNPQCTPELTERMVKHFKNEKKNMMQSVRYHYTYQVDTPWCTSAKQRLLAECLHKATFYFLVSVFHNRNTRSTRECYYPSMRTENKGLLALFSVRQGRWVYLFSEMTYIVSGGALNSTHSLTHLIDWGLASSAQCTLYGNPRTVDRNSWKKLQIAIEVIVVGTMPVWLSRNTDVINTSC